MPSLNSSNGATDAAEWLPPDESAWTWFAQTVLAVKRAKGLGVDLLEAAYLYDPMQ